MTSRRDHSKPIRTSLLRTSALGALVLLLGSLATVNNATAGTPTGSGPGAGTFTAHVMLQSGLRTARADYWQALGVCANISDPVERDECVDEAQEELGEAMALVWEQYEARLDLVALLGEGPYDPEIDPEDFVDGVSHPYFPLIPGRTLIYEKDTDEGLERIEVSTLEETTEVMGVECVVVHDVAYLDDVIIEDTFDWYAEDEDGNVWYFGELSFEYEDGEFAGSHGSWTGGEDGAKPGIIMQAVPTPGTTYRQEFYLGEAEDVADVVALGQVVTIDYGTFTGCVQTRDYSPVEPDASEHKFYAPGIGVVLEVDLSDGGQAELVEIIEPQ